MKEKNKGGPGGPVGPGANGSTEKEEEKNAIEKFEEDFKARSLMSYMCSLRMMRRLSGSTYWKYF